MDIIALFCEVDDFFLAYERWKTTHCLAKEALHGKHAGGPGASIRVR